ncbi:hypothetical protein IMZ48_23470 [Candidatus Bathyarchaeota archaeon]|nr:hypothetical protein [Candidatus Bathyarchaeota archaeon]
MDRLLLIHEIITLSIGGLYLAPLNPENMKRILDIGTGSGVCKKQSSCTLLNRNANDTQGQS